MKTQANYFLQTLEHLRNYEEVMLYANLLQVSPEQELEAMGFLHKEFENEKLNYPCLSIEPFDAKASLWAARTIYISAQLLLYRENKDADLEVLLPAYTSLLSASAHLSADIILRFLPDIITQLKLIDPEDALIKVLERHLIQWHFSGIKNSSNPEEFDFSLIAADPCLMQLYVDRVIEYKKTSLAMHPAIINVVKASLGNFASVYWNDFVQQLISEHDNR